jgi:hypothetical protein
MEGKLINIKRCLLIMAAAVLLLVPSCETVVNNPPYGTVNYLPIITRLEAETDWIAPSGSLQVTCTASDHDGDKLSYDWSASGGAITGEGAAVTWTAPLSFGSYNVTVTVTDGRGGEVMDYVTITVGANRPPTITRLVADAHWTTPSGNLQVTCTASDPDGDALSYEWTTTGGNISGTGAVVNWTAPDEVGMYEITVVVNDGQGGNDTEVVTLIVVTNTLPIIENLIVTAKEPKYLKKTSTGYKVGKTKEYYIECIASNTSGELVYEWSCTGGEISGGGSIITWTAPNTSSDVTVTVIVVDDVYNMDSENIVFEVVSCTSCTFG